MTAPTDTRQWLRDWVAAAAGCAPGAVDDATALFADGWLDSTDFVELLLAIEECRGRPVAAEAITPQAFRSIDAILTHFFAEAGHAASAA